VENEPVWTRAGFIAVASAILGVIVAFGVPLPDGAADAILVAITAIAPTAVALLARSKVTPNAKVPAPPAE